MKYNYKGIEVDILSEVVDTHRAFAQAWDQVQDFYKSAIDSTYRKKKWGTLVARFDWVDVTLNFTIGKHRLLFGEIKVDLAFFYPVEDQSTGMIVLTRGDLSAYAIPPLAGVEYLLEFSIAPNIKGKVPLYDLKEIHRYEEFYGDFRYYSEMSGSFYEVGKVWAGYDHIEKLCVRSIPKKYLETVYSFDIENRRDIEVYRHLEVEQHIDCVLVAEFGSITVLRWFPKRRKGNEISSQGSAFFHLGYIKSEEGIDLYQYMVDNDSRILFAEYRDQQIKIKGGIEFLKDENIYFPSCLINIPLYE